LNTKFSKIQPLVSIITPAFNSEKYIAASLTSVQEQSFKNWEHIIVDDNSNDRTTEIIQKFVERDKRFVLLKQIQNCGPARARNKALKYARGRFIAFLDSDDLWDPRKLEIQIQFMIKDGIPFTFSTYNLMRENGDIFGERKVPKSVCYNDVLKQCNIGCLTAVYDTAYFGKVEMPDIKKRQDVGLWLKLLRMSDRGHGIAQSLASYRVHEKSLSANKISAAIFTWRLYRNIEKLSLLKSLYFFSYYSVNGVTSLWRNKLIWMFRK
jgi:teichuronic acid biosynthesis glycosyltransferase TuaG